MFEDFVNPFHSFIMDNYSNPLMWFGFILIGIAVFSSVFGMLHPND